MSALSTYLKGKLVDHVLRASAYTMPSGLYLALHTANPTIAGNVGEINSAATFYTTYARQTVAFAAIATATTQNSATVTFPAFVGTDQQVSHWSIQDAVTGGNCLLFGTLSANKTLQATDVPSFPAGALQITWN
jgi:hypothetical protein